VILKQKILTLVNYKQWSNELTFSALAALPAGEATKKRQTRFGNMLHTLNHVFVIDDVFKAHLLDRSHPYIARNTDSHPPLQQLWQKQQAMDLWYIEYVQSHSANSLSEIIEFDFIGGGQGSMSRADMLLHVVNHGTYHRGFVGDMMYQVPAMPPANDYIVYLRDIASPDDIKS